MTSAEGGVDKINSPRRQAALPSGGSAALASRVRGLAGRLSITDMLALFIVAGEWTGLTRAAFNAPIYAGVLDVGLASLASIVVVGAVRKGTWRTVGPLGILIGAYFVLAAVEILNPNVPSLRAGLEGFRKTAFTAIAFVVVVLAREGEPGRFYRVVAAGSLAAFVMAIRQFIAPTPLDLRILESSGISPITFHSGDLLRAFSPTAGPFHLGILAACVMVISLIAARRGSWWWWLVAASLAGVALGLTITRANLAAAVASVIILAVVFPKPGTRFRNLLHVAPAAAAATLAILLAIGTISGVPGGTAVPPGATPNPGETPSGTSTPLSSKPPSLGEVVGGVVNPLTDRNLQFRLGYWAAYTKAVLERPIFGYGTSAAADGFDHFYAGTDRQNFEPHSMYFKAALEMGIPGVVLLLAILAYALRAAAIRAWTGDEAGVLALGILLVFVVSGISGPMLDAYPANVLFWATCGWCIRKAAARDPVVPSQR